VSAPLVTEVVNKGLDLIIGAAQGIKNYLAKKNAAEAAVNAAKGEVLNEQMDQQLAEIRKTAAAQGGKPDAG